ncbi:urease accessory UreF family protein [Hymenobacter sp. ASUV-10]|uniref:Urease accessory protein UreF n=1 Tax=Hymenobacter aranciens TaxID=3063996 RepID=A0ABT9B9V0_9BACT|nr:urease accessory UreF family protein [Hymenobacter sp. ASUV-10]MDO7875047.1 urease accessory UreF family protein [Hymenobacter sp. ASUV-10]
MSHFARLLHLVDSAIPTGSFAYSYGLESSISLDLVRDDTGLRNYLYAYLQQAGSFELPFITSCFQTELSALLPIAEDYDAQLLVPNLHRASAVQGRTWLRLLNSFYPEANLPEISEWFAAQELPPHFTLVFALALQCTGYALAEVQTMYLHMLLRDQLSAAIRLGLLGPLEGHRLQHDFYAVFEHVLAGQEGKEYGEATRSAFLLEVAQVLHEDLYTKLFQN